MATFFFFNWFILSECILHYIINKTSGIRPVAGVICYVSLPIDIVERPVELYGY